MNLWDRFEEGLRDRGPAESFVAAGRTLSGIELREAADFLSAALAAEGLSEGEVVALALPNSIAFLPAYLGLARLQSTVVLLSPKYGRSEVEVVRTGSRPRAYVATASFLDRCLESIGPIRRRTLSFLGENLEVGISGLVRTDGRDPLLEDHAALVKYTSGTLGQLKGIVLSPENLLAEAQNVTAALGIAPGDRIRASVPLFHSYGFNLGVLPCLLSGATLHTEETFIPRRMLRDLEEETSILLGTPTIYKFLLEAAAPNPRLHPRLRALLSCTAPLHPEIILRFHERFGAFICQHYGSSETGGATLHLSGDVMRRPTSVGKAMPGVTVWVAGTDGRSVEAGVEGEVVIEGDAVARGYLSGYAPDGSALRGASFHTGDLGTLDADGFLYLQGRKDSVINVGGLKVSPLEITRVLESCPAVREAAVVGVKDRLGEETIVAVVTLRFPATENEILKFCQHRLADYKLPRRVEIRTEMPRTATGKIALRPEDVAP